MLVPLFFVVASCLLRGADAQYPIRTFLPPVAITTRFLQPFRTVNVFPIRLARPTYFPTAVRFGRVSRTAWRPPILTSRPTLWAPRITKRRVVVGRRLLAGSANSCVDSPTFNNQGYTCRDYAPYAPCTPAIAKDCPFSCGVCETGKAKITCVDSPTFNYEGYTCRDYAAYAPCTAYPEVAKSCQFSCGVCRTTKVISSKYIKQSDADTATVWAESKNTYTKSDEPGSTMNSMGRELEDRENLPAALRVQWRVRTSNGDILGPYSAVKMTEFMKNGYIPMNAEVSGGSDPFASIVDYPKARSLCDAECLMDARYYWYEDKEAGNNGFYNQWKFKDAEGNIQFTNGETLQKWMAGGWVMPWNLVAEASEDKFLPVNLHQEAVALCGLVDCYQSAQEAWAWNDNLLEQAKSVRWFYMTKNEKGQVEFLGGQTGQEHIDWFVKGLTDGYTFDSYRYWTYSNTDTIQPSTSFYSAYENPWMLALQVEAYKQVQEAAGNDWSTEFKEAKSFFKDVYYDEDVDYNDAKQAVSSGEAIGSSGEASGSSGEAASCSEPEPIKVQLGSQQFKNVCIDASGVKPTLKACDAANENQHFTYNEDAMHLMDNKGRCLSTSMKFVSCTQTAETTVSLEMYMDAVGKQISSGNKCLNAASKTKLNFVSCKQHQKQIFSFSVL